MSYTIRDANQSDIIDILLLCKQFAKEVPDFLATPDIDTNKISNSLQELIESPYGFVKVICYDYVVVGALVAVASEMLFNSKLMSQELMFWIEPEHRNGKTSVKIIKEYVDWSENLGCRLVRLSTVDKSTGSKAGLLFQRQGFSCAEECYVKVL
jgi:hypothetical protein